MSTAATIALIAGGAMELIPVLREYIGVDSIKQFVELMDEIQEEGEMPTTEEIEAIVFSPVNHFFRKERK